MTFTVRAERSRSNGKVEASANKRPSTPLRYAQDELLSVPNCIEHN